MDESEGAIMISGELSGSEGDNSMPGPNRLLDHAFRSELERLSQVTQKSLQSSRRRSDKRKTAGRGKASRAREIAAREILEDNDVSRFFKGLVRTPSRRGLLLLLDASETMEQPSAATGFRKFDQACKIAAALSIVLHPGYERIQVIAVGHARGNRSPVVRSDAENNESALRYLKVLRPGGKPRFVHILQRLVKRLAMTTDCVILSDMLALEWEPTMALLSSDDRIHTSLIHISDPSEAEQLPSEFLLSSSGVEPMPRSLDIDVSRRLRGLQMSDSDGKFDQSDLEPGDYLHMLTDQPFERALISALEAR